MTNRQKTSAEGICFSLHVMSIFSLLLLLMLSVNLLSAELAGLQCFDAVDWATGRASDL